jgi:SH3-like domain-containing protein
MALLLALAPGAAWPQQNQVAPGSLPPPRPIQPAAPAPAAPQAAPAAPRPATPPATAPATTPAPSQARPPAPRPATPPASQPAGQARPAPPQAQQQGQRPPAQAQRPAGQAPAVGGQTPPQNRRPAAAAAGAAAGAAAAGAAAAATRTPEPAVPAAPAPPPQPTVGPMSGLPLPRFASLRSDQVNMRVGPDTRFPIEWTFQRRDLPVQIIGEFQVWRRVRDVDGAEGWVHQSTLAGRRTVLVRPAASAPEVTLRRRPEEGGAAVARLRPGVIARIRECEAANPWCEVQVSGLRGFLRRSEAWGIGAEEEVK